MHGVEEQRYGPSVHFHLTHTDPAPFSRNDWPMVNTALQTLRETRHVRIQDETKLVEVHGVSVVMTVVLQKKIKRFAYNSRNMHRSFHEEKPGSKACQTLFRSVFSCPNPPDTNTLIMFCNFFYYARTRTVLI